MSLINTQLGSIALLQPRQGYRFSIDSVLLADFATLKAGPVLDMGAGSGIITRLLARRGHLGPFVAVEINHQAAECCACNLAGINASVLRHDLREPHPQLKAQSFKLIVSNPPFGQPGRGRVSHQPDKAQARHQVSFTLSDLWQAAGQLLALKGRLALCLPPRLLDQALGALPHYGLFAKRLRLVHGRLDLPAKIALVEAVKGGGPELKVEPPLIIYTDAQNTMTKEVADIYAALQ